MSSSSFSSGTSGVPVVAENPFLDTSDPDRDYLEIDTITCPGINFACVSFAEPNEDTFAKRELEAFNMFLVTELYDKLVKRVELKKPMPTREELSRMYYDYKDFNQDDIREILKKKYPKEVFERAIKIRGGFKTIKQAKAHAEELKRIDPLFAVFS